MYDTIDQYFAALAACCLAYAILSSWVMQYCVDDEKVRRAEKPSLLFRSSLPPRSILTSFGLKVWWSRVAALVVMVLFVALAASFEKKEPIQQPQQQRP